MRMPFLKYLVLLLSLIISEGFTIRNGSFRNFARHLTTSRTHTLATTFGRVSYAQNDKTTQSSLRMSSNEDNSSFSSKASVPYGAALAVFLGFAAFVAPGSFGAESDNAMLKAYIDNPVAPGLNEIFNTEFNLLGIIPVVMACLLCPQASPTGLPPAPFLLGSAGLGYFGLAPYMIFRKTPRVEVRDDDLGWVVRNVFENKLFNWGVVALCVYQYGLAIDPLLHDLDSVWLGYVDLVTSSKFASVSTVDLIILSATAASVIPLDMKYRYPNVRESKANVIAASTLLLPILGAAVYVALRRNLPKE